MQITGLRFAIPRSYGVKDLKKKQEIAASLYFSCKLGPRGLGFNDEVLQKLGFLFSVFSNDENLIAWTTTMQAMEGTYIEFTEAPVALKGKARICLPNFVETEMKITRDISGWIDFLEVCSRENHIKIGGLLLEELRKKIELKKGSRSKRAGCVYA